MYCSIPAGKFINRGFMSGPYCPIYGTGAVAILIITSPFYHNPVLVFLVSVVVTTSVEYITGWLMETLFQMRWWDYSEQKFQVKGRICLKNSLLFGILSIVLAYFIHPPVRDLLYGMNRWIKISSAAGMTLLWCVDAATTVNSLSRLKDWLAKAQHFMEELKQHDRLYEWFERKDTQSSLTRLKEVLGDREKRTEAGLIKQLEHLLERKKDGARLVKAFPGLKPKTGMERAMKMLRENWKFRK